MIMAAEILAGEAANQFVYYTVRDPLLERWIAIMPTCLQCFISLSSRISCRFDRRIFTLQTFMQKRTHPWSRPLGLGSTKHKAVLQRGAAFFISSISYSDLWEILMNFLGYVIKIVTEFEPFFCRVKVKMSCFFMGLWSSDSACEKC